MPKDIMESPNTVFLSLLEMMRDEEDPESNRYMILNKAFNSLKKESKKYCDPDSLIRVRFIGPKIVSDLKKRWRMIAGETTIQTIPSNLPSLKRRKTSGVGRAPGPSEESSLESAFDVDEVLGPSRYHHPTRTPTASISTITAPLPKRKTKGRGRVSEFAPTLPAVDTFDAELDKQATSQHEQTPQDTYSPSLYSLIDSIGDAVGFTPSDTAPFPQFTPIVFPPHSFDITLVLDTREVKSQKNREYILAALQERGIRVVRRSLTLGDVLWIAQHRNPMIGLDDKECVLDYILERKRLDDLCISIKDGRFREQKFRLANTGLQVFYLIEEYDLERNRENFGVQIDTARSSTQIVDGFIVKETTKLTHTIDFLATMHRTIVDKYKNQPLYIIPPNLIKRHSYIAFQNHLRSSQPTMRYLTSYTCFERLNSKSRNMTARDVFAQMLLCVRGLSPEKAATIIAAYPTFRSLWEAFRDAEIVERENLMQEQEGSQGRKNKQKVPQAKAMLCGIQASGRQCIGPALSANLHHLMRAKIYEQ